MFSLTIGKLPGGVRVKMLSMDRYSCSISIAMCKGTQKLNFKINLYVPIYCHQNSSTGTFTFFYYHSYWYRGVFPPNYTRAPRSLIYLWTPWPGGGTRVSGVLQSMGSQKVKNDLATEQQQKFHHLPLLISHIVLLSSFISLLVQQLALRLY